MLEALGRVAADPQGSAAGVELGAQGSWLFMGGTEGGAPHGSTGATGLGADPGESGERFSVGEGEACKMKIPGQRKEQEQGEECDITDKAKWFHAGSLPL